VLVPGHGPLDHFMPSSQCVGCHQAGATGLQIDMLDYGASALRGDSPKPVSVSPYSLWSSSPMGLAGRDPIFYSQLESEQIIHADNKPHASPAQKAATRSLIQDTCLQCHGVMGQRQHAIDTHAATGSCAPFARATANAVPYPHDDETWAAQAQQATYGALARDGISCTVCHRLAIDAPAAPF
jgi:mono/diheme cytochrome c family protein